MDSIIVSDLAYRHSDRTLLFEHISLSVGEGRKISVIGDNGTGKSTLLRLIAGELEPYRGGVRCTSAPYHIPQNAADAHTTIARALKISRKLSAIEEIGRGNADPALFDILADDWDIEARARQALEQWGLKGLELHSAMDSLSGGERTKVMLAGISLHSPQIVLLDEPTNHMDLYGREMLYGLIEASPASFIVVSHDVALLDMLDETCELSPKGIKRYGGNYDFYRLQKEADSAALSHRVQAGEKALRLAGRKAQEVQERQQRRQSAGGREVRKGGLPRIIANARAGKGEETRGKRQEVHRSKIRECRERLAELRAQQDASLALKLDFSDAVMHSGKLLFKGEGLNHEYTAGTPVWDGPLDFALYSGERVHLEGGNGSGKTTLVKMLTGELEPSHGVVTRRGFTYAVLDQHCDPADPARTVLETAASYNVRNLEEHAIKTQLNRSLFPKESWDKRCGMLSGGERMRLRLCCLTIANDVPDVLILDEPTNNLDISSMRILADTVREYRGSLLVISHDRHFVGEAGIGRIFRLDKREP